MFKREIIEDVDILTERFISELSEYILANRGGMGLYTISPLGDIYISDGMHVSDLDYHDCISGLIKMEYPEEYYEKLEEYNEKYPELTEDQMDAELIFNPNSGAYEHPYSDRILERHFAEMELRKLGIASVRPDNVRRACQKAIDFFKNGPKHFEDSRFYEEDDIFCDDDSQYYESMHREWKMAMQQFLSFEDEKTVNHIKFYEQSDLSNTGLAPDYPVRPEDFDPKNEYDILDLFYHEDMKTLLEFEWKRGSISRAIVHQLCNDFYFALFMDELEEHGNTDNWWFEFSFHRVEARVYTPGKIINPISDKRIGYFPVNDYIRESCNELCPIRLDIDKVVVLLRSLGL